MKNSPSPTPTKLTRKQKVETQGQNPDITNAKPSPLNSFGRRRREILWLLAAGIPSIAGLKYFMDETPARPKPELAEQWIDIPLPRCQIVDVPLGLPKPAGLDMDTAEFLAVSETLYQLILNKLNSYYLPSIQTDPLQVGVYNDRLMRDLIQSILNSDSPKLKQHLTAYMGNPPAIYCIEFVEYLNRFINHLGYILAPDINATPDTKGINMYRIKKTEQAFVEHGSTKLKVPVVYLGESQTVFSNIDKKEANKTPAQTLPDSTIIYDEKEERSVIDFMKQNWPSGSNFQTKLSDAQVRHLLHTEFVNHEAGGHAFFYSSFPITRALLEIESKRFPLNIPFSYEGKQFTFSKKCTVDQLQELGSVGYQLATSPSPIPLTHAFFFTTLGESYELVTQFLPFITLHVSADSDLREDMLKTYFGGKPVPVVQYQELIGRLPFTGENSRMAGMIMYNIAYKMLAKIQSGELAAI